MLFCDKLYAFLLKKLKGGDEKCGVNYIYHLETTNYMLSDSL